MKNFSSLSGNMIFMTHWHYTIWKNNAREWYTSDYQNRLREEMDSYDGKFFDHHCTGCRKHEKLR